MATNHYFNHYGTDTPDQKLVESIVIESIKSFGIDVHYMPRTEVNTDSILVRIVFLSLRMLVW